MHLGAGDGAAKVVLGLDGGVDGVAAEIGRLVGRHLDLVLRLLVLGHGKAGADVELALYVLDLQPVAAQGGLGVEGQLVEEGAHVAQGHVLLVDLLALGIANAHCQRLDAGRQAVVGIVVGAELPLK